MDGQPVVVVSDLLLEREREFIKNNGWQHAGAGKLASPRKLEWQITEKTADNIKEALVVVKQEIDKSCLSILCLPGFGTHTCEVF